MFYYFLALRGSSLLARFTRCASKPLGLNHSAPGKLTFSRPLSCSIPLDTKNIRQDGEYFYV